MDNEPPSPDSPSGPGSRSLPDRRAQAHIDAYLDELRDQRQLAALTVASYRRDLAELTRLMATLPGQATLHTLTHQQVRGFAVRLHARGLNARSIARTLSAWRGFFNWLAVGLALPANPVDGVKAPKRARPLPNALSVDDAVRTVKARIGAIGGSSAAGDESGAGATDAPLSSEPAERCDLAMFELLYSSGLRVSELVALDHRYVNDGGAGGHVSNSWLDLESAEVMVTGKGGKQRRVPVGRRAIEALTAWLAARPVPPAGARAGDSHALFINQRGRRMSVRVVQLRLKAHAQAVGIPADVHPHMLRHSFASHVLQSSGDLRAVQEMLGHASITSTQIYTSLDFMHLAKVYDAAHPRAKKNPPDAD